MSLFVGLDFLPFGSCHFFVSHGVICGGTSGAGAKASKPGELDMAVVLLKQLLEMSQADILLTRGLCANHLTQMYFLCRCSWVIIMGM